MALIRIPIVAVALAFRVSSFSPNMPCSSIRTAVSNIDGPTKLFSLIKGEAFGAEPFDENEGGVGLAKRAAIKIVGVSNKGKGTGAQEIVRYEKMQELDEAAVKSIMEKAECQLLCSGTGKETYQDPGSSYRLEERVIKLAPIEAAQNALSSMASAVTIGEDTKSVVFNFLGGDELIIGEVLQACDLLVDGLDFPTKTKVVFNSVGFTSIPEDVCSVVVVASGGKASGLEGADESVARGELYVHDGKWSTVAEGDIIAN